MKRTLAITLLCLSGCATTFGPRVINAGESYCSSSDPKVCAELFTMMQAAFTPEMEAAIHAAKIPGRTQ